MLQNLFILLSVERRIVIARDLCNSKYGMSETLTSYKWNIIQCTLKVVKHNVNRSKPNLFIET